LSTIEDNYVDPVPQALLIHRSLEGMDDALDRHSAFYPPEVWHQLAADVEGRFVGLGVECSWTPGALTVERLVKEGPAEQAGIQTGDQILANNGQLLQGLTEEEARKLLVGEEGQVSTVRFLRGETTLERTLAQLRLSVVGVESSVSGKVGYLAVHAFREGTAATARIQLNSLRKQGITGMILDLRGNGGGLLEEGVGVADLFMHAGKIVSVQPRSVAPEEFSASASADDWEGPMVVLVDENSASASEVAAGALQRSGRSRLMGARSYGKGTVQRFYEYEDGSVLKLTFARYFLPDGTSVEDKGLQPDLPCTHDCTEQAKALFKP
jgi:carboxyl-terminal processing protease